MAKRAESTRRPIDILTADEIDALLKACSARAPTGVRDRALIAMLASTAVRLAEVLDLRVQDVDCETGAVFIHHGKGDSRRTVAADAGTLALVEKWLRVRERHGLAPRSGLLFCTVTRGYVGRPLSQQHVRQMLRRRALRARVTGKRVHPHGFRHTRAVHLARAGVSVKLLQHVLGHKHVGTTDRYLVAFGNGEALEAMRTVPAVGVV